MLVFVYGSLMSGLHNHYLLEGAAPRGPTRIASGRFRMASMGSFPAITPGDGPAIVGELYEVDAASLARLDRLEGHPDWYRRRPVEVVTRRREVVAAQVYAIDRLRVGDGDEVVGGDWRSYLESKETANIS